MSKNILLVSVATIKERTGLHFNVDEKLVYPEIKTAQDMYITPALGTDLFERIQQGIVAQDLNSDEVTLLNDFITDALIYFVLCSLPIPMAMQFYNKGAVRKTDPEVSTLSMGELADYSNHYQARAEWYKQRLISYLCANSTLYPQYYANQDSDDIHPESNAYRCSVALDDDDDDDDCNCLCRKLNV